jgi:hypothetical protein
MLEDLIVKVAPLLPSLLRPQLAVKVPAIGRIVRWVGSMFPYVFSFCYLSIGTEGDLRNGE